MTVFKNVSTDASGVYIKPSYCLFFNYDETDYVLISGYCKWLVCYSGLRNGQANLHDGFRWMCAYCTEQMKHSA